MSNVSFGGNWSEELVELAHIRALLANLEWAVENCTERDVNTQAVRQSLEYIHNHIDKGPMLTARWNRGYAIEIAAHRQDFLAQTYRLIADHMGG